MSLSWPRGCAAGRGARPPSGSPRSSRRSWCSPSRPGTRNRTPRRAPAYAWRCSSGWRWPSAGGCPLWASALDTDHKHTNNDSRQVQSVNSSGNKPRLLLVLLPRPPAESLVPPGGCTASLLGVTFCPLDCYVLLMNLFSV